MKWDIDKSLASLSVDKNTAVKVYRSWSTHKTNPEVREEAGLGLVWCIEIGHNALKSHGKTIREAFLRLRRKIKVLSEEERTHYGVKYPKRSNSYAAARRKKGSPKTP